MPGGDEVQLYFRVDDYKGGAYTFSDGTSVVHADYFSGWDEVALQKVLDECANNGESASKKQKKKARRACPEGKLKCSAGITH